MSWYKDFSNPAQTWTHRLTFLADMTSEAEGDNVRVALDLGAMKDFDALWDLLADNSGDDVRIAKANGAELVSQAEVTTSINTTTRVGVIKFDATVTLDACMQVFHLYIGNASASSAWGTVVNTDEVSAHFAYDARRGGYPVVGIQGGQAARSGDTRDMVSKHPDETVHVGFLIEDMHPRCEPFAGMKLLEEVAALTVQVLDGDTNQPSMTSNADLRLTHCLDTPDKPLVRTKVSAGTDGTDYGIELTVNTTEGRVLVRRVGLSVRQTTES